MIGDRRRSKPGWCGTIHGARWMTLCLSTLESRKLIKPPSRFVLPLMLGQVVLPVMKGFSAGGFLDPVKVALGAGKRHCHSLRSVPQHVLDVCGHQQGKLQHTKDRGAVRRLQQFEMVIPCERGNRRQFSSERCPRVAADDTERNVSGRTCRQTARRRKSGAVSAILSTERSRPMSGLRWWATNICRAIFSMAVRAKYFTAPTLTWARKTMTNRLC